MANPPDRTWDVPQSQPNLPTPMPVAASLATGSTMANPYRWPLQAPPLSGAGSHPGSPQTPPMGPVAVITITSPAPPNGTHAVLYPNFTMTATGGTAPLTWTATGVPAGMTLSTAGVLGGTPTTAGTYQLVVTVTDSAAIPRVTTANYTLVIA